MENSQQKGVGTGAKVGIAAAIVLAGIGILYWIFKDSKKSYKEMEKRENENKKIFQNRKITEEEVDEQILEEVNEEEVTVKDDNNSEVFKKTFKEKIVRKILAETYFESEVIEERNINVENITQPPSDGVSVPRSNVVHLQQRFDKGLGRQVLDLLFELPIDKISVSPGDDGDYRLVDFKDAILGKNKKSAYNETNDHVVNDLGLGIQGRSSKNQEEISLATQLEEIVKNPDNLGISIKDGKFLVKTAIEGYYYITYDSLIEEDDEERYWDQDCSAMIKIPLEKYAESGERSQANYIDLGRYIKDLRRKYRKDVEVFEYLEPSSDDYRKLKVIDTIMTIRLTFVVQDDNHLDGINVTSGLKVLEHVFENFEVRRNNKTFKYQYFLFYDPDRSDERIHVYDPTTNENGKRVIRSIEYV